MGFDFKFKEYDTKLKTIESRGKKIYNVPHWYDGGELFPGGEDTIIGIDVVSNVSMIIVYMNLNGIKEFDYNDMDSVLGDN